MKGLLQEKWGKAYKKIRVWVKYRKGTYMTIEAWGNTVTWLSMGTEVSFDDDDMISLQLSISC